MLSISKITGFACSDKVIRIDAPDGRGLYYMQNPKGKRITFNLIPGRWETENKLTQLPKPLEYLTPPLPDRTVLREVKKMNFRVGDNPNKCTIDFSGKEADVLLDHEIANQDIPFITFVLYHENGHYNYGGKERSDPKYKVNESYCDIYAAYNMLRRGYNPSQCNYAGELCLSEANDSKWRKDQLYNWLKKVRVKNG